MKTRWTGLALAWLMATPAYADDPATGASPSAWSWR